MGFGMYSPSDPPLLPHALHGYSKAVRGPAGVRRRRDPRARRRLISRATPGRSHARSSAWE